MDRSLVHRRLREAGLPEAKADALTALLWNVHGSGMLEEVDFAHLSDAGFRHLDVCIMRELLAAALSRRQPPLHETQGIGEGAVGSVLGAIDGQESRRG